MAKINIPFNGTNFLIDESALASATTELQSHMQTEMSGTGAVIELGGNTYNVDSTKLTNERNAFVSHLGTIAGSGSKVTVNGIEYGIDSNKVSAAVSELTMAFGNLQGGSGPVMKAAGLYETGTDTMVTSWDELLANGDIVVNDGAIKVGSKLPELPEKNEYGFYYGVPYGADGGAFIFYEDGSFDEVYGGETTNYPSGSATYSNNNIHISEWGLSLDVVNDGLAISDGDYSFELGQTYFVAGDLVLPADNSITSIPDDTFAMQYLMTGITIPNGVTSIGGNAFSGCRGLTSIKIPDSVTSIGRNAFDDCTGLTSVTIPNNVTSIGMYAFHDCTGLTSIEIPDSVTSIDNTAFAGCTGLTSVVIGDSVTSIAYGAFYDCTSLTSVTIPNSVTSIGDNAFYNCTSLSDIYYKGSEEQWNAIDIGKFNYKLTNATIHYNYQG